MGKKIQHNIGAVEQLSPCTTTIEPTPPEPVLHNKRSHLNTHGLSLPAVRFEKKPLCLQGLLHQESHPATRAPSLVRRQPPPGRPQPGRTPAAGTRPRRPPGPRSHHTRCPRSQHARAPRGRSSGPHPRARAARPPLQEGPVVTGGQDPDGRGWGAGCGGRGVPGQLPIEEQLRASPESCVVVPDDPVGFK